MLLLEWSNIQCWQNHLKFRRSLAGESFQWGFYCRELSTAKLSFEHCKQTLRREFWYGFNSIKSFQTASAGELQSLSNCRLMSCHEHFTCSRKLLTAEKLHRSKNFWSIFSIRSELNSISNNISMERVQLHRLKIKYYFPLRSFICCWKIHNITSNVRQSALTKQQNICLCLLCWAWAGAMWEHFFSPYARSHVCTWRMHKEKIMFHTGTRHNANI